MAPGISLSPSNGASPEQTEKQPGESIDPPGANASAPDEEEMEEEPSVTLEADEDQVNFCSNLLKKFLVYSESTFLDNIDLILMLRAMNTRFSMDSVKIAFYEFNVLQMAIIAF